MIFLLDIGNSAIKVCELQPDLSVRSIEKFPLSDADGVFNTILKSCPDKVIVAATAAENIVQCLRSKFLEAGISVAELTNHCLVPFTSCYVAGEAGIDRLANVAAAVTAVALPALVIDAGTAITFEVIEKNGVFAGGAISPGLRLQTLALNQETGRLPKVTLEYPSSSIATSTVEAIRTGVAVGTVGAVVHLIEHLSLELSDRPNLVLTGGDADFLRPHLKHNVHFVPDLTLSGLAILAKHNRML